MSADSVAPAPSGRGKAALYDHILAAIDALLGFVDAEPKHRLRPGYSDLLRLDQRLCSACQLAGLSFPPVSHAGSYTQDMFLGFCRIPVARTVEGIILFEDDGWSAAMDGLRQTAESLRERELTSLAGAVTSSVPRQPTGSERVPPNSHTPDANVARARWEADPILSFERLRDHVCAALDVVIEVARKANEPLGDVSLSDAVRDVAARLENEVIEAQSYWFDTPITRFLDRSEGPVNLDGQLSRNGLRVSGACYHDLALSVAVRLLAWSREPITLKDYAAALRFCTGAGDHAAQHVANLKSQVRCECQQGISRYKAEPQPDTQCASAGRTPRQPKEPEKVKGVCSQNLSESESLILQAMLLLKATDESEKQGQEKILKKAGVDNPQANNYSHTFARLRDVGLVETKVAGRSGGTWLTNAGVALAGELAGGK